MGKNGTHLLGGYMGPTAGLEFVKEKTFLPLPGLEPLTMQAVAYSPYQLCYRSFFPDTIQ
jgi:hypothetical protein